MKILFTTSCLILQLFIGSATAVGSQYPNQKDNENNKTAPIALTLEKAIKRALLHNRNLHGAMLSIENSKLSLEVAHSDFDIKLSPLSSIGYTSDDDENTVFQVGGTISKKHDTGISLNIQPSSEYSGENYTSGLGFSLNIPLMRGLGQKSTLDNIYTNEFSLKTSERSLHTRRVNTVIDTVSQVYNLLKDQQLETLYNSQIKILQHHLLTSQIKKKTGLISIMDVYRAELRIKDVEENVSSARERITDTANRLKNILAIPIHMEIAISAPMTYQLIDMEINKALAIALQNRIEIKQSQADIQESKRKEMLANHNILPQLDLVTRYQRQGRSDDFNESFDLKEDVFAVQLSSNTDFARTPERAALSRSQLNVKQKQLDHDTAIENISREVYTILNSLEKTAERITLRKDQVNKASGKQELAHVKFKYGEADNFDLIEAQTQLQTAEVTYLSEKIKYIIETYRLRAKLGTLLAYEP